MEVKVAKAECREGKESRVAVRMGQVEHRDRNI